MMCVQGYFEALRMEQAHNNIDVTLVCPGPVYSKIAEEAFTGKADKVLFHVTFFSNIRILG